jgi:hypothetical protein
MNVGFGGFFAFGSDTKGEDLEGWGVLLWGRVASFGFSFVRCRGIPCGSLLLLMSGFSLTFTLKNPG